MKLEQIIEEEIKQFDSFWMLQFPNSHPAEYGVSKAFLTSSLRRVVEQTIEAVRVEKEIIRSDWDKGHNAAVEQAEELEKQFMKK